MIRSVDGALDRALEFERESMRRVGAELAAIPEGWVVRMPSLPLVWSLNHVEVTVPIEPADALTNATMPYVVHLATAGVARAVSENPGLKLGVNVAGGHVTYEPVAEAVGVPCVDVDEAMAGVASAS